MYERTSRWSAKLFGNYDKNGIFNKYNSSKGIVPAKEEPKKEVKQEPKEESLNEDQRTKKRQLKFIVDQLEDLYKGHSSYQVFLRKAQEELAQNKGIDF